MDWRGQVVIINECGDELGVVSAELWTSPDVWGGNLGPGVDWDSLIERNEALHLVMPDGGRGRVGLTGHYLPEDTASVLGTGDRPPGLSATTSAD